VITARDPNAGDQLCAWIIARVIDDTVFVDTIASHTDRLTHRPNDAIIFQCLVLAEAMGIQHAHYSLKSKLETLETFKQSLGFVAHPFPSRLRLRRPIGPALKLARPEIYMRLLGDPVWMESDTRRRSLRSRGHDGDGAETTAPRPDLEVWPRADVIELSDSWYIPGMPASAGGWVVYSLDFVLATLQGSVTEPHNVRRTPFWLTLGTIVRGAMAVAQLLLMIIARIPILSWFYEIAARTFSRNAVGFFLRSCYWKARLKRLGTDTLIDQGVEIWGAANVSVGSNCHVDTNVRLAAGERRHRQRGAITIGDYSHIGPGVHIAGRGTVVIGDFVGVSALTHIYSATNAIEEPRDPGQLISMSHMAPPDQQHVVEGPIVIEPYAFIGMMARIMPNVRIGFGSVIHAAAEVTRDVPPFANLGGPPRGRQIGWRRPRRKSPHHASSRDGKAPGTPTADEKREPGPQKPPQPAPTNR
jgi:acetyltransferase-like isoleucine patch superfamily enzyme